MLTDITLGQYFPGTSFLHKLDPRIKIVATMIFIVAIFFAHSLASYAIVISPFPACRRSSSSSR